MKILIVGANFINKGGQSMLFITTDEIMKRIPGAEVYYGCTEAYDEEAYTFRSVFCDSYSKAIALGKQPLLNRGMSLAKSCAKWVLGRRDCLFRSEELRRLMPQLNLIVDVSGYNLGRKWSAEVQENYLNNIRLAKKYGIPIVMMPQSFGPFDYSAEKAYLLEEIRQLMPYPLVVYAREEEGARMLRESFGLSNVRLSTDLVLQNSGVALEHIFTHPERLTWPKLDSGNAVALIPNRQCFLYGDREQLLALHDAAVEELCALGREVVLLHHSSEDKKICAELAERYAGRVRLIDEELSCLAYDNFVRQFQYIVCSRYHGLVHAYRNGVPSVALGWAVKYADLAAQMGQTGCALDVTSPDTTPDHVREAIRRLDGGLEEARRVIRERVAAIQADNCFQTLSDWAKGQA